MKVLSERLFLNYYMPFTRDITGPAARYRSDDIKQSYLAGCVGSSSSVLYFPDEVADSRRKHGSVLTIGCLSVPGDGGSTPTAIQQGAGVAVFNRMTRKRTRAATGLSSAG
ncbi:MAG: hypothetical protein ACLTW9_04650 [Enterocloster sp.]